MKDIAAAGFTTVQTSPANECEDTYPNMKLMGNDESKMVQTAAGGGSISRLDWKIGNYQLGSRDDFKAMCAEADKYGIKVIVDVIPNHTTPDAPKVSDNLLQCSGWQGQSIMQNGFKKITQWATVMGVPQEMGGLRM